MMMNMFSMFDPMSYELPMNWFMVISCFLLNPSSMFVIKNYNFKLFELTKNSLYTDFKNITYKSNMIMLMGLSLIMTIIYLNLMGLLSYNFSVTSHMSINLAMATPLWVGSIIYMLKWKISDFLVHLIPEGTPSGLIPLMVVIEIISNAIRPITLAIRLSANMIAGHILVLLISSINMKGIFIAANIWGYNLMLNMLELGVCVIQGYVFGVLCFMYMVASINYL